MLDPPRPLPVIGSKIANEISFDGKSLYFDWVAEDEVEPRSGTHVIGVYSYETGDVRRIDLNGITLYGEGRWSKNNSFFSPGYEGDDYEKTNVYEINMVTGEYKPIIEGNVDNDPYSVVCSPNGKEIFYEIYDKNESSIICRNVDSGRAKTIYFDKGFMSFDVSSDGTRLAISLYDKSSNMSSIKIISIDGADPVNIAKVKDSQIYCVLWNPNGEYLHYWRYENLDSGGEGSSLWSVSIHGGNPKKLWETNYRMYYPRIHPDGQRIAFSIIEKDVNDIWVMENFLPNE